MLHVWYESFAEITPYILTTETHKKNPNLHANQVCFIVTDRRLLFGRGKGVRSLHVKHLVVSLQHSQQELASCLQKFWYGIRSDIVQSNDDNNSS